MSTLLTLLLALLVVPVAPTPQVSAPPSPHHLEYRFGWNTKLADSGPLTGTIDVDLSPAPDDGTTIGATELWWNALRPNATNTCLLSSGGDLDCGARPYALSTIDLALLPMLAEPYFGGIKSAPASWEHDFHVIRGGDDWICNLTVKEDGAIPNAAPLVVVESSGTCKPQGARYREETDELSSRIAYDPVAKLPIAAAFTIRHHGQNTTQNLESVQLKFIATTR